MNKRTLGRIALGALVLAMVVIAGDAIAQDGASQVFAPAPATSQEAPSFIQSLISMLPMLAICYLIFWVMVIRPQEAKAKKHKELVDSLKRGDSVVTTGGLIGRVASVEKDAVMVEIAPNVKVKIVPAHVLGLEKGEGKAEAA